MPFAIILGIASQPASLNFTIVDAILFYGAAISSFEAEEPGVRAIFSTSYAVVRNSR
jgi:hypothetical protein